MKVCTRIVIDMNSPDLPVLEEESFEYEGPLALCEDAAGSGLGLGGDNNAGHGGGEGGAQGVGGGIGGSRGGPQDNDIANAVANALGIAMAQSNMSLAADNPSQVGHASQGLGGVLSNKMQALLARYPHTYFDTKENLRDIQTGKALASATPTGGYSPTAYGWGRMGLMGSPAMSSRTMPGMATMSGHWSSNSPMGSAVYNTLINRKRENARNTMSTGLSQALEAQTQSELTTRSPGGSKLSAIRSSYASDPVGTMSTLGLKTAQVQDAMRTLDPLGAMLGSPITPAQANAILEGRVENGRFKTSSILSMLAPVLTPFGVIAASTPMGGIARQIAQNVASATFGPKQAAKMAGGLFNTARAAQVAGIGPSHSNAPGSGGVAGIGVRTAAVPTSLAGGGGTVPGLALQWLRGRTQAIPGLAA